MEEIKNGVKAFYAKTQADWRQWLAENHEKEVSVWLIIYKKDASANSLPHSNAVDEALCYKKDLPDAYVHIIEGAHMVLETNFEEVLNLINNFLSSNQR